MSTYARQPGVPAVRIGTYRKRGRFSSAVIERRPDTRRPKLPLPTVVVAAEPSYADFFRAPSAVSEVA